MVDCNGEGILFLEVEANFKLEQLGDAIQPPCPYLEQLIYNLPCSEGILGFPLLLIEVTHLMCGGFTLAIHFNHNMCDELGLVQFVKTIQEMARVAFPAVRLKGGALCNNPLGYAVALVKKAKAEMSKEHIRSAAYLMEVKGRRPRYPIKGNYNVSDLSRYQKEDGETGTPIPIRSPRPSMKRFEEELKRMIPLRINRKLI
ncbi:hypothetical protein WN944_009636 [Citrus x changshan-huyou]|uniref:Uncharacterized protein n=1 Tax=Citrus x changshan-huyou TaxID=2935761 RepID=A0AAP0MSK9_9ROSI